MLNLHLLHIPQPLEELLAYAGKDLSHFFDDIGNPRTRVSVSGAIVPCLAATIEKSTFAREKKDQTAEDTAIYWWNEPEYIIGKVTKRARNLRIINTLTSMRACINLLEKCN